MPSSKRRKPRPRRKGPTPRNRANAAGDGTASSPSGRPARSTSGVGPAAPNARYTPKVKDRGLFRPTWHKVVGAGLVALGITIFVVNDLVWFDIHIMPGGHNELYAVVAIGVAASSLWWFGAFDRPPQRR